jgi:hypothetical protein
MLIVQRRRVGVLWTPADISTALWLDAADASTVTTVSGAVSQWNDKSGNGRNCSQDNSSLRPFYGSSVINNRNAVEFSVSSAAGHYLDGLASASVPLINRSLFYVIEATTLVTSPGVFVLAPTSGNDYESTTGFAVEDRLIVGSANLSYLNSVGESLVSPFLPTLFSEIKTSGTGTLSVDGGRLSSTDSSFTEFSSTSSRGYLLGARFFGSVLQSGNRFRGRIAELIYIGSTVSVDTQRRIEGYLAHKWNLTANLPNDHPYKTAPPTV